MFQLSKLFKYIPINYNINQFMKMTNTNTNTNINTKTKELVTITDQAKLYISNLLKPDNYLNIKVVRGGCNGLNYDFQIASLNNLSKSINDCQIDLLDNKKIVIDNKSILYMIGSKIDLKHNSMTKELIINNPNKKSSCGCGESFKV